MRVTSLILAIVGLAEGPPRDQHPAPALQKLGTVRFVTSCAPSTRIEFNRAVALLHSFAFGPAIGGFNAVLRLDPRCTMAYWGLALSAWGNPFAAGVKPAAQIRRGLDLVERAREPAAPTDRERRYLAAVTLLYENVEALDQRTRLLAYRDAMAELTVREPSDTEAAIFHALAMGIAADPADKSYASQLAAGATLERLFAALPDHPGLAHYIIHVYDVPPLAGRALVAAHRYAAIAPTVSHALHMPSHTFTRVGDWQQSIEANVASARAARQEGATAEELHSADYRAYAYLQTCQDRAAERLVSGLPAVERRFDPNAVGSAAPPAAGYFALAAIPARYALERGAWGDAAHLPVHQSPVPFADAVTLFARALGAARIRDTASGRAALLALERVRDQLVERKEGYWSQQVEIQRRAGSAWLLSAAGRKEAALAEMRAAAELEDATEKNAITTGPLAPARELLGEMLLVFHEPSAALSEFEGTLQHEPNRFRALAGAARAAEEAGNGVAARKYYRQLLAVCAHADRPGRRELADARRRLGRRPETGRSPDPRSVPGGRP